MNATILGVEDLYLNIFESASDGIVILDLETGEIITANLTAAAMHGYARDSFCKLKLQDFIFNKNLPLFANYAQVIRQGGLFNKMVKHIRKDNSLFFVDWQATMLHHDDHIYALAFLRDASARIQLEHRLKQRMMERMQEQSTLLQISHAMASTLELQPYLILDQLKVLIKYSHASLFTLEDSTLITLAVRGIEQLEKLLPFQIRLNGKQTLETLFNEHHPIRIADLSSDDPSAIFLRTLLVNDSAILLKNIKSWMWVPLAVKNRIVGGIGIAHTERNFFTPHYADLAMTIANQAAITLVNAELYEHAQALAALQERQRLAQNLHDAVNQSLFSAGLIAEVLPRLWDREPDEARRSLEDLRRLTRGAMAEMRAMLAELRPSTLTDEELGDLLLLLANAFSGRTNIPVDVSITGEFRLPSETQVAFYHICQEALNNIAKHAKASLVEINLHITPKDIKMSIHDNGCGFDTSLSTPSGHYGLKMIHEYAEAIGAVVSISSQPGSGTEITVYWKEKSNDE